MHTGAKKLRFSSIDGSEDFGKYSQIKERFKINLKLRKGNDQEIAATNRTINDRKS